MRNRVVKSILVRIAAMDTARRFFSRRSEGLATVFLLHRAASVYAGINGHDPDELECLLKELIRRKFNLVSLQQVVDAARGLENLPSGAIAFTVDDGYRDQIEVIAPIFIKHQVPLTVFLPTGLMTGELWPWDAKINWLIQHAEQTNLEMKIGHHCLNWSMGNQSERLNTRRELQAIGAALPGEKVDEFVCSLGTAVGVELPEAPPTEFSPASWDQIRQLESAGVRFAPHTHTHRILSRLQEAEVCYELKLSLEIVMSETRCGLPILAYPVGMEHHFGLREMHLAKSIGFTAAFAVCEDYTRWGEARFSSDLCYRLARFGFPHSTLEALWIATGLQTERDNFASFLGGYSVGGAHINNSHIKMQMGRKTLMRRLIGRLQMITGGFENLKSLHLERIKRLVFVCRGNVCRSPYAEAAAKALGFSATSCGVDVSRNDPAEMMAVRAALLRGNDISLHISRSILDLQLESSDCLVAMDPSHLSAIQDVATSAGCQVTLIGLWRNPSLPEIADPYGKSLDFYHICFNDIDQAVFGLMTELNKRTIHNAISKTKYGKAVADEN